MRLNRVQRPRAGRGPRHWALDIKDEVLLVLPRCQDLVLDEVLDLGDLTSSSTSSSMSRTADVVFGVEERARMSPRARTSSLTKRTRSSRGPRHRGRGLRCCRGRGRRRPRGLRRLRCRGRRTRCLTPMSTSSSTSRTTSSTTSRTASSLLDTEDDAFDEVLDVVKDEDDVALDVEDVVLDVENVVLGVEERRRRPRPRGRGLRCCR